ncbi:phosphonate C-P lyase system protein PhnG [Rhodopila sp.]|uniref:phosphonate C-P lyase system protein PhnG n=1 Tax=Rhodopila sp. TaxID=2480087 RepID=UPI003D147649
MNHRVEHPYPGRRRWMSVLARAPAERIDALLAGCAALPDHAILRGPEAGLVMVRGRAGGGGAAFNLGEMTVTRCTVRTATGRIGHAYVAGRDMRQAELAALVDALMLDAEWTEDLEARVILPLEQAQTAARADRTGKAAATRVQFFAMQTTRA